MRNFRGYFRVFEPVLRVMGADGARVHLAYDDKCGPVEQAWADSLERDFPNITSGATPDRRGSRWHRFSRSLRVSADYLRFLRPEFATTPELRARAADRAPNAFVTFMRLPGLRTERGIAWMTAVLKRCEQAIPSSPAVDDFIEAFNPDVVVVSPLLSVGSMQPDYLKSAQSLGIPTMVAVASWDNLSSKSLIRFLPDAVTVWNETQRREAVELHDVPPERVVVTGAQSFDPWFGWTPGPRALFLTRVGLPLDRPFVLYVCSSLFASPITEAEFVRRWIGALRSSAAAGLREAAVLIRPHPKRNEEWSAAELSGLEHVVIWPRTGTMPVDDQSKADYYDSMFHSAAVVGLNTSALIEAGIVGRAVHTLLNSEFAGSQDGTLHFQYLTDIEGGLLRVATTMDEHVQQLSEALGGTNWGSSQRDRFLRAFVRPYGLDVPASPLFVNAVLTLARERARPLTASAVDRLLCLVLSPLAFRSQVAYNVKRAVERARKAGAGGSIRAVVREYVKMARGRREREKARQPPTLSTVRKEGGRTRHGSVPGSR
jgi:hypothetical protein